MDTEALRQNAGRILAMFREVLGRGDPKMLLYAAGMAGMSCHEAVKAEGKPFAVIELKDGTRRYMGDALNHYLLEDRMSVLAYIEGWFAHFAEGEQKPDPMALVTWAVQVLGTPEEKIWGAYTPADVYPHIRECWNGIYQNMTANYCRTPGEMPVLFGIVLQNAMADIPAQVPRAKVYEMALSCALIISKLDDDSILK